MRFQYLIETNFNQNEAKEIMSYYDMVKNINTLSEIYSLNFAVGVAEKIIKNKLDKTSCIVALLFPFALTDSELDIPNQEVKDMLKSLIQLDKLSLANKQDHLDSVKHMFMAIAKDVRVIIIKLCIEQEKVAYLNKFTPAQQEELMKGFNEIYAPVSAMLGISSVKNALYDATFKFYKPAYYAELKSAIDQFLAEGSDKINLAIEKIKNELEPIIPNVRVYGRQKQLYSIAKKLQQKNMDINTIIDIYGKNAYEDVIENSNFKDIKLKQVVDILACRVIVNTVEECYMVLGKIYSIFTPIGNFKDYISQPKENGYQSIHTLVKLPSGDPLEIQIRTFDMHTFAEYGFAAHWAYKEKKKVNESDKRINYIRQIMDYHKEKSSAELVDILKTDVYSGKIFVQSPMGKILEFPDGSTPIDFAYAIHSKIGDKCVGCKINGKMMPLTSTMNNGDVVEIITNVNSKGPSRDWLKIVKTSGAKSKINNFFKKEMKEDNIKKGKSILENTAKLKNINLSKIMIDEYLEEVYDRYSLQSLEDMYATVGYGGLTSSQILNKLVAIYKQKTKEEIKTYPDKALRDLKQQGSVNAHGYSDMLTKFGKCCSPLPGDEIIGFISRGKGITVHRVDCPEIKNHEFERLIECSWNKSDSSTFVGTITVLTQNMTGVISKITKKINDAKININGLITKNNPNNTATIKIQMNINSKQQLDDMIEKIRMFSFVIDVHRG